MLFRVVGIGITLLSVYAISFRRSLVFVGMALAIPALMEHFRLTELDASATFAGDHRTDARL